MSECDDFDLHVSDEAHELLWDHAVWYANKSGSDELGLNWHAGFVAAIDTLRKNPRRCGIAHESESFPFELRELLYGLGKRITHRALFRIIGNCVHVLSIRHVSQKDVTPKDLPLE